MGLAVINRTSYGVHPQFVMAGGVEETLIVVVRASHGVHADGRLEATSPAPIVLADSYRGDPARSSLVAASDVTLAKPAVDLLFSGCAYPARAGDRGVLVRAAVGGWEKRAVVAGERVWRQGLGGLRASEPAVMEPVPLIFERAFGGHDPYADPPAWSLENPAGVGYMARAAAQHDGLPLPNIEAPEQRIGSPRDRPAPCGFGPIAPHWPPRARQHDSYDALWLQTRAPLPPRGQGAGADQVAPADQVYQERLRGGEAVILDGMRPAGARVGFALPRMHIEVVVHDGQTRRSLPVVLDTLHVDTEALRLDLTWRASLSVHGWLDEIEWILITEAAS